MQFAGFNLWHQGKRWEILEGAVIGPHTTTPWVINDPFLWRFLPYSPFCIHDSLLSCIFSQDNKSHFFFWIADVIGMKRRPLRIKGWRPFRCQLPSSLDMGIVQTPRPSAWGIHFRIRPPWLAIRGKSQVNQRHQQPSPTNSPCQCKLPPRMVCCLGHKIIKNKICIAKNILCLKYPFNNEFYSCMLRISGTIHVIRCMSIII